jgi:Fe-S oxidoreductase
MNRRTIELFQRYQPEEVVMWCPSCIYFSDEIRHFEFPFRVRHTTELLEDMTPCQLANGVDPERARALVTETFRPDGTASLKYLPS